MRLIAVILQGLALTFNYLMSSKNRCYFIENKFWNAYAYERLL